ncbi:MAG TPA: flagellar hook-associated protein FlgK [Rhodospirillaceae bacterium]|nr:flagellar hook-associated protein FlgK [Rhodospirillaceae bacterium]
MSLASALTISLSGIQATSTQLELTASNISNAATEGYSTKRAILSPATLGSVGGGTQVIGFSRAENAALYTTLTTATSDAGLRATQNNYLQQVQDILGTSSSDNPTLATTLTNFVNAWKELAASPESLVAKRQVVQDATTFVDEVRRISTEVEALDRQCTGEINATLVDLNGYLEQIRDINQKISQAINSNLSSGDLQDQRDQLVLKVSEITGVTVLTRSFGQIALYTSTGYQLVDGSSAREFSYDGTTVSSVSNPGLSLNTALAGGSLDALVNFRATTTPISTAPGTSVIQKLRSQLDMIVGMFTNTVTSATSTQDTFAAAYNAPDDVAAATIGLADALTFTAAATGPAGNTITVTVADDLVNVGNYEVTITNGTVTETYSNLSNGLVPGANELWTNLSAAIAGAPSALVTTAVNGTGNLDPTTLTLPTAPPLQLAGGYSDIIPVLPGELSTDFFVGTNRTTFAVNAALLDGTATVKTAAAIGVTDALLDATRAFGSDGLALANTSYVSVISASLTSFQQAANNVATLKTTAENARSYLEERYSNETGVNVDNELVNLTTLQNSYAASAHVMSVVQDLFIKLEQLL